MNRAIIAPVGKSIQQLFQVLETLPSKKIILLSQPKNQKKAEETKQILEGEGKEVQLLPLTDNLWESVFERILQLKPLEKEYELILHTSTGDRFTECVFTSASFVHGIKAIAGGKDFQLLPIMKFSYYKVLTEKKLELLRILENDSCCSSLEELSTMSGMSLPLISYHINGTLKSEGLKELGLVETTEEKGKISTNLSTLGKLMVKGYIQ